MIKIEESDFCKTCKLVDMYNELEEKIDKAIEVLESYSRDEWDDVKHMDEAIWILKGENNGSKSN